MGYAIPGALAARLAHPDRPVVAFTGDGGFMMAIADVQTAVHENLPIIIVVFDDQEIALIRVKQELKGIPRHGVGIGGIDWESLAKGLGAEGDRDAEYCGAAQYGFDVDAGLFENRCRASRAAGPAGRRATTLPGVLPTRRPGSCRPTRRGAGSARLPDRPGGGLNRLPCRAGC